jgi:Tol biopolymer transport system component
MTNASPASNVGRSPVRRLAECVVILLATASPKCAGNSSITAPDATASGAIPWSRVSGRIAYSAQGFEKSRLYIIDGTTRLRRTIAEKEGAFESLAWAPDGRAIAYVSFDEIRDSDYRSRIHAIDADGNDLGLLSPPFGGLSKDFPSWSPDGRLTYWSDYAIWIGTSVFYGEDRCELTRAAWSPDGQFLAISTFVAKQPGLFLFRVSDRAAALIQPGRFNEEVIVHPTFSPSGERIAFRKEFFGDARGTSELWTSRIDGSDARRLTTGNYDWSPAWSPDGTQIAFTRGLGSASRLYIITAEGERLEPLVEGLAEYPTWTAR